MKKLFVVVDYVSVGEVGVAGPFLDYKQIIKFVNKHYQSQYGEETTLSVEGEELDDISNWMTNQDSLSVFLSDTEVLIYTVADQIK